MSHLRTELFTEMRAELLPQMRAELLLQMRIGRSRDGACVGTAMFQDCLHDVVATWESPMP